MPLSRKKIEKLKINTYSDEERKRVKGSYELQINPDSYTQSLYNKYSKQQGINTSGRKNTYVYSAPRTHAFKIMVDGTIVTGINPIDVHKKVEGLLEETFRMDGHLHQPRFLRLVWGDLNIKCRLASADVTYTLFGENGKPLRAEIDAVFIEESDDKTRIHEEGKSSPDLTHVRIVKDGDTLPLLCESIYGTSVYYPQVASANKLKHFQELTIGQELYFPPLQNEAAS